MIHVASSFEGWRKGIPSIVLESTVIDHPHLFFSTGVCLSLPTPHPFLHTRQNVDIGGHTSYELSAMSTGYITYLSPNHRDTSTHHAVNRRVPQPPSVYDVSLNHASAISVFRVVLVVKNKVFLLFGFVLKEHSSQTKKFILWWDSKNMNYFCDRRDWLNFLVVIDLQEILVFSISICNIHLKF